MKITGSIALVTGANRGLGLAFAQALLARGAAKVYAAVRDPKSVALPGVVPLELDVTKPDQVASAAGAAADVTLLVNNAGIARGIGVLAADALAALRAELETNVIGTLLVSRAFAPILGRNGGGAIVNVLSVASWINRGGLGTYATSKAAEWSLTNALRNDLRGQGTHVVGLHAGFIDTDLARGIQAPKARPEDIVARVLDGLEAGAVEVIADDISAAVKRGLSSEHAPYLVAP